MSSATARTPSRFVAELSSDEFILLGVRGLEPVGFVSGDCVSIMSNQTGSASQNTALTRRSQALSDCASAALRRMRDQAAELGATGVLGVKLTPGVIDHKERPAFQTCSATGTAVRRAGSDSQGLQPFTTHLRAVDAWTLVNSGCRILGLVFGYGVYQAKRQLRVPSSVEEMTELTDSMYGAREAAVRHMQGQAGALHANGVIAVEVEIHTSRHSVVVEVRGTAIKAPAGGPTVSAPQLATTVTDRPAGPLVGRGSLRRHDVSQLSSGASETEPLGGDR